MKREIKDNDKPRIIIHLEGGLIQDIKFPDNLDVVVEVRDFDVEGADEAEITSNKDGQYFKSEWEND